MNGPYPNGARSLRRGAPNGRACAGLGSGFTLLELIFASALAVVVLGAALTVTQNALRIWTKGETVRDAREVATVALGAIAEDLRALHPSAEGDLLVDWQPFDLERDGTVERVWPRLRLVRDVSGAKRDAIERRAAAARARSARKNVDGKDGDTSPEELSEEELLEAQGVTASELSAGALGVGRDVFGGALSEVLFALVPEGNEGASRTSAVLIRAERLHVPGTPLTFFDESAFLKSGVPALELGAQELVAGVLWLEPLLATQTTQTGGESGWRTSGGVETAATSWDAWRRGRPDIEVSSRNEPAPGMALASARPLLPRAVRLEIEVIRPAERRRAPTLVDDVDSESATLFVTTSKAIRRGVGRYILVGSEWMVMRSITQDRISVARGRRGTQAVAHGVGTPVLLGEPASLEVPIALHDDAWVTDGPASTSLGAQVGRVEVR